MKVEGGPRLPRLGKTTLARAVHIHCVHPECGFLVRVFSFGVSSGEGQQRWMDGWMDGIHLSIVFVDGWLPPLDFKPKLDL